MKKNKDILRLSDKSIVRLNHSVWEKKPLKNMRLDTDIVRCRKYLFPESRGRKLLYIGFDEGQNLLYFAEEGFQCYGTEISKPRIRATRRLFKAAGQKAELRYVLDNTLPYPDNFFDAVVSWQSLYYNNAETFKYQLNEIYRVLKPGGRILCSMISRGMNQLAYHKIGKNVYQPMPRTGQSAAVVFVFENKRQIGTYFKRFSNLKIGYYSSDLFYSRNFHYVIYAEKPQEQDGKRNT